MSTEFEWDLGEMETTWTRRRARLAELQQRVERSGMTRPARSAGERAWLEQRGELPPTREVPTPVNEQGSVPRAERPRAGDRSSSGGRILAEHERAVLLTDLPEQGLRAGDVGTVAMVYRGGEGYEVEFMTLDGETIAVLTLEASQVRPIE